MGPNPTDRAKPGVKRSLLVEADGGPLAVVVAPANRPDDRLLADTLDALVLDRPGPEPDWPQHLCLDAAYDTPTGRGDCVDRDYYPHIRPRRPAGEPPAAPTHPPRRWPVERTHGWLATWRGILIRWEKKAENYLGLIQLACALLWFRRYARLAHLR